MKLPSALTTVTPLSKRIALLLFIMLPILFFIIGMNYGMYGRQLENGDSTHSLQTQLDNKEKEIKDIIEGKGYERGTSIEKYSAADFGINSPLFENKDMEVRKYEYRRTLITKRTIELEPRKLAAVTWTFKPLSPYQGLPSQVIFGDYENYAVIPTSVDSLREMWTQDKPYTDNKPYVTQNRTFNWSFGYFGKGISAVHLETESMNLTNRLPLFIQLKAYTEAYADNNYINPDVTYLSEKNDLKKIADSIPYRSR